jgi:hypothetical protein
MNNIKIVCTIGMLFFASLLNSAKAETVNIIKNVRVVSDTIYQNVKGLYIEYIGDFSELQRKTGKELMSWDFNIVFTLKSVENKGNSGLVYNEDVYIRDFWPLSPMFLKHRKIFKGYIPQDSLPEDAAITKYIYFIPYVAIKMNDDKHIVDMQMKLYSTNPEFKNYEQTVSKTNILIAERKNFTVTMFIKTIDVVTASKGWFGNNWGAKSDQLPDICVKVKIGDKIILKKQCSMNSTTYNSGPLSQGLKFKITQGDEFKILIEDYDWLNNDFIGDYDITPTLADIGTIHTINENNTNIDNDIMNGNYDIDERNSDIIQCNINWSIEETVEPQPQTNKLSHWWLITIPILIMGIVIYHKKNK